MMNKKNIGILSMQRIVNYGSFMQALGLKLLLKEIGYESCFVDYHIGPWYSIENFKNTLLYKRFRKLLGIIKKIQSNPERDAITSQYDILGLDEKYHYREKVDLLIIGSDEVFNYIQSGGNVLYSPELIGYNSRADRIISYAASCGNLTKDKLIRCGKRDEFANAMKRLSAISVRDKNTYSMVKDCTNREALMHLDPVLLADFSELEIDNFKLKDYILIYGYTNRFTTEEGKAIKSYAERCHKKLIALGGSQSFCETTVYCKPMEVFSVFRNASLVITDTFHGTIFSLINNKNVSIIIRDGEEGNTNKLSFLVKQFGIENKVINNIDRMEEIIERKIDYSRVMDIRKKEKVRTLEYLASNISE